jgi:hypothetical protein
MTSRCPPAAAAARLSAASDTRCMARSLLGAAAQGAAASRLRPLLESACPAPPVLLLQLGAPRGLAAKAGRGHGRGRDDAPMASHPRQLPSEFQKAPKSCGRWQPPIYISIVNLSRSTGAGQSRQSTRRWPGRAAAVSRRRWWCHCVPSCSCAATRQLDSQIVVDTTPSGEMQ